MDRTPRDDYYVLVWNFIDPLFTEGPARAAEAVARFRDLACNGGTLIATFVDLQGYHDTLERLGLPPITFKAVDLGASPFLENDFPFYVENICRTLYRNWNEFKPIYREHYRTFAEEGDRHVFVSAPCVNDPAVAEVQRNRIAQVMEGLRDARHLSLLYDLRDEPSITSFLLADDGCFCEHCLARMRAWLKDRYGDLAALNAEWGTAFTDWDAVEPITTLEALDRRDAGRWNFAPWHDHRGFMNQSFVDACRDYAAELRKHDPDARVGLAGTQCPSVFGGYDFSLMVPALDWAEPYDFANSVDCIRSFAPRREFPILKTSFPGGSAEALAAMLWTYLFQAGGCAGTIIWHSNRIVDIEKAALPPAEGVPERVEVYAELRHGFAGLLQAAEPVSAPVAVHYSQASLNADFITSVPNRWRAVAGSETGNLASTNIRDAWWKLLEDRGLRPTFIASHEIEAGALAERGTKVLVLPRSIAMSDAEAEAMTRFVEAGGILVADSFVGRMDEHCRERERGALDDLFGISRRERQDYTGSSQRASYAREVEAGAKPRWGSGDRRVSLECLEDSIQAADDVKVMGCTEMTDTPVGIVAERGKGRAVLLNAAPINYPTRRRLSGRGRGLAAFFGAPLDAAGVTAHAQVLDASTGEPIPGWKVWPFRHGEAWYFGLAPDMAVAQDTLGAIDIEEGDGAGRAVRVTLAVAGHIYEARSGRFLGEGDAVEDHLEPTSVRLYAVLPYAVEGIDLHCTDGVARARVVCGPAAPGRDAAGTPEGGRATDEHVLRFDLFDSAGKRLLDSGANVVAPDGAAEWTPDTPLPDGGRLVCRDVATGVSAEVPLN